MIPNQKSKSKYYGEPRILRFVVKTARNKLEMGKSGGEGEITAEELKIIGEVEIGLIHKLLEEIWNPGD